MYYDNFIGQEKRERTRKHEKETENMNVLNADGTSDGGGMKLAVKIPTSTMLKQERLVVNR